MAEEEKLRPEPLKLKRKPRGGIRIKDLEPSDSSFKPADLTTCKCPGLLHGEGVIVTQLKNIWALVKLGSYGKGMFSRTVPSHHHIPSLEELKYGGRKRGAPVPSSEEVERTWKKRIKLHSQWKEGDGAARKESGSLVLESGPVVDDEKSYCEFVQRLLEIRRSDPMCLEECLQLGAEEAFYLAAEAKVLSIQNAEAATLSFVELWQHFGMMNKSFPARYVAYAHYRTGNWVPKSGLKFGVDFLLYKEGPLSYHSSFAVIVKEEGHLEAERKSLTWKEVIALNRVSESAGKELLICHVGRPSGDSAEESMRDPACVQFMSVKDTMIKRWVPEKDREM